MKVVGYEALITTNQVHWLSISTSCQKFLIPFKTAITSHTDQFKAHSLKDFYAKNSTMRGLAWFTRNVACVRCSVSCNRLNRSLASIQCDVMYLTSRNNFRLKYQLSCYCHNTINISSNVRLLSPEVGKLFLVRATLLCQCPAKGQLLQIILFI